MFDNHDTFEPPRRPARNVLLLFLGVGTALLVPLSAALALVTFWQRADVDTEPAPDDAPVAAAEQAAPPVDPVAALLVSQDEVKSLQADLDARTAELAALRADPERQADAMQVAALETAVTTLRTSLEQAQAQRDGMRHRLRTALAQLDEEVDAHAATRREVATLTSANTENLWVAFTERTKIDVCEQPGRRGRAACRSKLDGFFDETRHERFASCVTQDHAVPSLFHREHGEDLPSAAEPVGVGTLFDRDDWFVLFCDPTLPEAVVASADAPEPPVFSPDQP
jgi:hypothetical protein